MTTKRIAQLAHVTSMGIILFLYGCASVEKQWERTSQKNDEVSYKLFLEKNPDSSYATTAKIRINELRKEKAAKEDWPETERENTVAGYEQFIQKHPRTDLASIAESRSRKIQAEAAKADWPETERENTVAGYEQFIQKYPRSDLASIARSSVRKLQVWESTQKKHTVSAYEQFFKTHAHSSERSAYSKALSSGTDEALLGFILYFESGKLTDEAITKLKDYEVTRGEMNIPWRLLPRTKVKRAYVGSFGMGSRGSQSPVGIDMKAFSYPPSERWVQSDNPNRGKSMVIGSERFYAPDLAILYFSRWTSFDGYIVKGKAVVGRYGLTFDESSVVIKK